jgi:hypothetical protein
MPGGSRPTSPRAGAQANEQVSAVEARMTGGLGNVISCAGLTAGS